MTHDTPYGFWPKLGKKPLAMGIESNDSAGGGARKAREYTSADGAAQMLALGALGGRRVFDTAISVPSYTLFDKALRVILITV
jgi:hypothetical protein